LDFIAMARSVLIDKPDSENKPDAQRTGVEMPAPDAPTQAAPEQPRELAKPRPRVSARIPGIIFGLVVAAVVGLSIWYLVRPQPLLVQGEVDATRFDIAARVDGRVADIPVVRGQNVLAGAVLVRIDNPETLAKHEQTLAAKVVAEAQLANINAGTRAEVIAARKAALERAQASVVLAQKTYDRVSQLAEHGNAPQARLDQATDSLHESERAVDQAKSAYDQAVNGYTREEREIAVANVQKASADITAVQAIIDQMVVYAPMPSQVYKRNVEPGEYVSPGVPLITLIDLNDMWVHFDLREDLVRMLKVGDRFDVRIPALADRRITVEVRLIATKGEYASWRATRATGDFDLRTFSIRAYPVDKVPELRPGMSAYLDWRARR
jgi:HlyD family secretion protein